LIYEENLFFLNLKSVFRKDTLNFFTLHHKVMKKPITCGSISIGSEEVKGIGASKVTNGMKHTCSASKISSSTDGRVEEEKPSSLLTPSSSTLKAAIPRFAPFRLPSSLVYSFSAY